MQASGHCHFPAALPLGIEGLLPTGQEDGWIPEPVWTFPLPEFEPQIVQPLAYSLYRRYSSCIPCRCFHIKWLHPTLRLSQMLRIENCMMVIQCTTRTGLFLYSPTSISAYVYPTDTLSTKCSQFHDTSANRPCPSYWNYERFSFLW
jgi:hypothetical protein